MTAVISAVVTSMPLKQLHSSIYVFHSLIEFFAFLTMVKKIESASDKIHREWHINKGPH